MKTERHWCWIAWGLWAVPPAAIAVLVAVDPYHHNVALIYHKAVENWWARQAVYTSPLGFNYLPSFLPLFSLFASLPFVLCDILWRWAAFAGLAFGLWLCTSLITDTNRFRAFAVISILSLSISMSTLRDGQSSAQLAACLVLASWCLHRQHWWRATLWLCLSLVCKPLGIPAIGLAVMAFPRLWWRVAAGVAVVAVAPYLFAPPSYVNQLYVAFFTNMVKCFDTGSRSFADLNGVTMVLNVELAGMPSLIVRVLAGAMMAVACWLVGRLGTDIRRVLFWLGFTGIYIMLFTPMNEANSYVMLAPALALWAWWHVEQGSARVAEVIAVMPLTMVLLPNSIRHVVGQLDGELFAKVWCPLMTIIFLGILLWQMRRALTEWQHNRGTLGYEAAQL